MELEKMERCIDWLREQVKNAHAQGLIVGLSGGIDSALVGYLIAQACPNDALGVILPCHSSGQDREDAILGARAVKLPWLELDLSEPHSLLWEGANELLGLDPAENKGANGNLRARLRMSALYTLASLKNYLVVGTDNKAEYYIGYFTKYGDGGVDLLPIGSLTKAEVYLWAREAGIPQKILAKAPSAGLWPGQTDESELGLSYSSIDQYLEGKEVSERERERIEQLHGITEHKRHTPPCFIP